MRKIEELLEFKVNLQVYHELECQILFDNRKDKIEEESLLEEYDENIDTVSWESIEATSWELMKNKGMNWKLFSVWLESIIYIYGWDQVIYCFECLKAVLNSKLNMLLDQEDRVGCIDFTDKSLSRGMLLQPIKDEDSLFQFLSYKKSNPQRFYDILSTFDKNLYNEFLSIYKKSNKILIELPFITKEIHIHFSKVLSLLDELNDILSEYFKNFLEDQEDDLNQQEMESFEGESIILKDKEFAFKQIAEALELLQRVDYQNISIPLLRKIMRWKTKNISEILNELNTKEGSYFILSFLMD